MKIGVLTNSLANVGMKDLKEIAAWAYENKIQEIDVGPSIDMDQRVFEEVIGSGKVDIKTMIYCRNMLSQDKSEAEKHQKALEERIEFAGRVGIEKIVCATGVLPESYDGIFFRPEKSMKQCIEYAKRLVEKAERNNVKLCYENCPLMGNIASSPDVWKELFDGIDSEYFGLCYDPSHLVWQFIDPYRYIFEFKDKIFHVHGKDTQIDYDMLGRVGVLQSHKWWRHRLPGLGDLDWMRIIDSLYEIGYQQAICIEHEDPVWDGSVEKVKKGILKTKDYLTSFFV